MKLTSLLAMLTATLPLQLSGQRKAPEPPAGYPYSAAFVSTISAPEGHTELVIFPFRAKVRKIPIHHAAAPFSYGLDGRALYGACTPEQDGNSTAKIALCRIDLKTGATIPVVGTIHDFYPSRTNSAGSSESVNVFGLILPDGNVKAVSLPKDKHRWMDLSISPDQKRAVATHCGTVELIDLDLGTIRSLGDEFFIAAWSPDGKWLAAVEKGERGKTVLMDAKTLSRKRVLGTSELDWSPDSHYLIGFKSCDSDFGTLEAVDVETGLRTVIESSRCVVNQATTGWVSNDVLEK
jgi:WD40 repeat protein